jgi:hypothetical protein
MNKINFRRRVKTLLENKNNNFKRKYFLLSLNSVLKESNHDKFVAYADVLFKSNGNYPSEEALYSYLKESSLKEKKIHYIKNYLNLLYSNKKNIVESVIDEELSSINDNNRKLDLKLKETLIETYNRGIDIFNILESEDKLDVVDASSFLDNNKDIDDVEEEEMEKQTARSSGYKQVIKDYSWLLKPEKINFIRNKLKLYIPKEFDQQQIDKMTIKDKLAIIKNYDLIINKKASVKDLRKLEILSYIDYYLNIKQELIKDSELSKITSELNKDKDLFSRLAGHELDIKTIQRIKKAKATTSYIDPVIKTKLKELRNKIINKGIFEKNSINLDAISENELFNLLGACLSKDDEKFYMKSTKIGDNIIEDKEGYSTIKLIKQSLDAKYRTPSEPFKPQSDEEYQEYLRDLEAHEESLRQEEEEEMTSDPDFLSAEEAESAEADPDAYDVYEPVYAKEKIYKKDTEGNYILDDSGEKKIFTRDKIDDNGNKVIVKLKKVYDAEGNPVTEIEVEESEVHDLTPGFSGTKKQRARSELDQLIDSAASPAEMFGILQKHETPEKSMSYKDIANLSLGRFRDAPGVRQEANKSWFKALFFNTDHEKKSEIYDLIFKKYLEVVQKKDLFRNVEGPTKNIPKKIDLSTDDIEGGLTKDDISAYFTKDLKVAAAAKDEISKEDIEDYFSGQYDYDVLSDEEEIKKTLLDDLLKNDSTFRHFSTALMKDFYDKEIWSGLELDLAHAVVDYFKTYFSVNKIGESLSSGEKSNKVLKQEGKDLFNPIIYWVMRRTGVSTKGSGVYNVQQDKAERGEKFIKGFTKTLQKFNKTIDSYNENVIDKLTQNKPGMIVDKAKLLKDGILKHNLNFTSSDFDTIIDDMTSDTGIIGGVYAKARKLDKNTYDNFIKWLNKKSDEEISNYINSSLTTSFYYKEGFILDKIARNGKDEIVLVKKDNPNEIHLLSPEEERLLNNLAKEVGKIANIDLESYKELALSQYQNNMSEVEIESWISDAYECNYYDKESGKLYNAAEIIDVSDDMKTVKLSLDPDSENPKTVDNADIAFCTPVK